MEKEFTFKTFTAKTIDKLKDEVNYHITRNNVSLDKIAIKKIQFLKESDDKYTCIIPLFDGDNKIGRPLRVHFMESDNVKGATDKINFYLRRQSLSFHHIIDYQVDLMGDTALSYIFFTVPESVTNS